MDIDSQNEREVVRDGVIEHGRHAPETAEGPCHACGCGDKLLAEHEHVGDEGHGAIEGGVGQHDTIAVEGVGDGVL